jgi:hypothetical protein
VALPGRVVLVVHGSERPIDASEATRSSGDGSRREELKRGVADQRPAPASLNDASAANRPAWSASWPAASRLSSDLETGLQAGGRIQRPRPHIRKETSELCAGPRVMTVGSSIRRARLDRIVRQPRRAGNGGCGWRSSPSSPGRGSYRRRRTGGLVGRGVPRPRAGESAGHVLARRLGGSTSPGRCRGPVDPCRFSWRWEALEGRRRYAES